MEAINAENHIEEFTCPSCGSPDLTWHGKYFVIVNYKKLPIPRFYCKACKKTTSYPVIDGLRSTPI